MFVRRPTPGMTKTRLIPALGAEGAAEFYRGMAERVAAVVLAVDRPALRRIAYFDPAGAGEEVATWLGSGFDYVPQPDIALGERLVRGFEDAFEHDAESAVAVGTDCVEITPELLAEAFDAMAGPHGRSAVVGPASDGGYWLIGLRRPRPEVFPAVFTGIEWSTPRVTEQTLTRLSAAGATVHLLPELRDIDRPEDLARPAP